MLAYMVAQSLKKLKQEGIYKGNRILLTQGLSRQFVTSLDTRVVVLFPINLTETLLIHTVPSPRSWWRMI